MIVTDADDVREPDAPQDAAATDEAAQAGGSVSACWLRRGCDEEMRERCPHNIPGEPCPAECSFAACFRATHVVTADLDLLLNPDRDYDAAVKEVCRFCEHFLTYGPSMAERPADFKRQGNPNRFLL